MLKQNQQRLQQLHREGAEAITQADVLAHDGDPYRAVVKSTLEVTGRILTLENTIDWECPSEDIIIFPSLAPDAYLESQYEEQQNGGYGEE